MLLSLFINVFFFVCHCACIGPRQLWWCWVVLSTPVWAMGKWGWTSSGSTQSSSEAEQERLPLGIHSDTECGPQPTLPLAYSYNFRVGLSVVSRYPQAFDWLLSLSLSLSSLLVRGHCWDRSSKLDQSVRVHWAKEQVGIWGQIFCCTGKDSQAKSLNHKICDNLLFSLQSLNFSCSGCRHRLGSYWPTLEVCAYVKVVSLNHSMKLQSRGSLPKR